VIVGSTVAATDVDTTKTATVSSGFAVTGFS
jgi:hypothetical protein